jgi:hypothetical protein
MSFLCTACRFGHAECLVPDRTCCRPFCIDAFLGKLPACLDILRYRETRGEFPSVLSRCLLCKVTEQTHK